MKYPIEIYTGHIGTVWYVYELSSNVNYPGLPGQRDVISLHRKSLNGPVTRKSILSIIERVLVDYGKNDGKNDTKV